MELIVAKSAGFCFGVKRAVETVQSLVKNADAETHIYTLGKLIHNPQITQELSDAGVTVIDCGSIADDIAALHEIYRRTDAHHKSVIVTRTHGVVKQIEDTILSYAAENTFFSVVDCTCPYVKKIHSIVSEYSLPGTLTVLIGDAHHPEVEGICSRARGDTLVVSNAQMLKATKFDGRQVILAAQTTQKLTEWKECQNFIRKVCTNPQIFDTICSVTETRQTEADALSKQVDLMIVIGGRESSNTNKLYRVARQNLDQTFLVEDPSELPLSLLRSSMKVGITAGASTPGSIIREVKQTMNNEIKETESQTAESFAEMLEKSFITLNTGDTVKGIITSISPNEIHVDLGTKVTGIIPLAEMSDNPSFNPEEAYKVGDEIETVVCRVSDLDGVATLSRKRIENALNWKNIVAAYENNEILEGIITDVVKGGLIINIDGSRVFVPNSHSGLGRDADVSKLVGTTQRVKIIELNEQKRRAVASIRTVKNEERKELQKKFWETVEEGKWYEGTVKSLTSYGAFVDLGGVDGMVHSSELSWKRIKHPSDVVSVGDTVKVYVKSFDPETKRISLGYKTEDTNPWTLFTNAYKVGDVVSAKIVSMMPFGAFAEIIPGADGLIHISQIVDRKITKPADVLELGQVVDVKIVDIDYDNKKISLSMRALLEDNDEADEEATDAE